MLVVPDDDYFGSDQFTYEISDGTDTSRIATVTLEIQSVNDAPVASSDAYFVGDSGQLQVVPENGLLKNDVDIDDARLSVELIDGPEHGEQEDGCPDVKGEFDRQRNAALSHRFGRNPKPVGHHPGEGG